MKYTLENAEDIGSVRIHDSAFTGFEYKARESNVRMTCDNEYFRKTYFLEFKNVICVHLQSCRFWGSGNSIQCMYVDEDKYIDDLRKVQDANRELYGGSRLSDDAQMFTVGLLMNSGDVLTICCSEVEIEETNRTA